jgi:hypothetical protein
MSSHILTHSMSSNPEPRPTTHMLTPLRAGSSAMSMDTANTTLNTRSLWTTPTPSSMLTMLSSSLMEPPTHAILAFPSPCPTTPLTHPTSHPRPLHHAHPHSRFLSALPRTWSTSNLASPPSHHKQPLQYWQYRMMSMMPSVPSPLASSPLSTTMKSSMVSLSRSSPRTVMTSVTKSASSPSTSKTRGTMSRCQRVLNQMQATSRPKFLLAMAIEMPSGSDIMTMDELNCWLGRAMMRSPSPLIYISHQTTPQMPLTQYPPGSTISSRAQPPPFIHSAKQWLSCLDSTCHLTRKLSSRFRGSGLVVGVPPTSIVRGISGCPF